ncbi:hypothetical protein EON63_04625 [archaeon]|nr:MAG: hypothetical protein EON63_04625 [archaeon]
MSNKHIRTHRRFPCIYPVHTHTHTHTSSLLHILIHYTYAGESLPVAKFRGDRCQMGSTVVRGEVEATVELTGARTFFGRTASLLQVCVCRYP